VLCDDAIIIVCCTHIIACMIIMINCDVECQAKKSETFFSVSKQVEGIDLLISRIGKHPPKTHAENTSSQQMTNATNNSVPDYTSTNTVGTKTKVNDGDSLRCIADSDASTLWDSSNESISHESNNEHSAASTLCDSSLDSNEDRSAASTIDYENAAHPFDNLAKLCNMPSSEWIHALLFT
jgi:hypothetical protein